MPGKIFYTVDDMTTKETSVPAETLKELDLHEGDRFSGEVRDGQVKITVVTSEDAKGSGVGFAERWRGRFKAILETDLSDDPRAEYLLNR